MSFSAVISTIFEVSLVLFTLWAVFHEDRFIALENRIAARFRRRRLKVIHGTSTVRSTCVPTALRER